MLQASFSKYTLEFKKPSGTSRGVLKTKDSWFIEVFDSQNPDIKGIGECGLLEGLSSDDWSTYLSTLQDVCDNINDIKDNYHEKLAAYPSIRFGVEMALLDLRNGGNKVFFDTSFTQGNVGIPINGLIWMGDADFMQTQMDEKIAAGYSCIKMKIGAINFNTEFRMLKQLRKRYSKDVLEIRVDANGAFNPKEAYIRLDELSKLHLHSIEQPIAAGNWKAMHDLCRVTPLPIALDEELIGIETKEEKKELLDTVKPQYIILKPSLVGGFLSSDEWIELAEDKSISWWATSALESNIGLNAIAQWAASKNTGMFQGLGTGQLYTNNIPSDLEIRQAQLWKGASK